MKFDFKFRSEMPKSVRMLEAMRCAHFACEHSSYSLFNFSVGKIKIEVILCTVDPLLVVTSLF